MKLIPTKEYLLLIDEEVEIKIGQFVPGYDEYSNKIIDVLEVTNLEQFHTCKLIVIAYYPLTKEAKELDLPLLPPLLEDWYIASKEYHKEIKEVHYLSHDIALKMEGFITGYKAAQSKQFSLEDMKKAYDLGSDNGASYQRLISLNILDTKPNFDEDAKNLFDNLCKSLSTQQLPKEFVISDKFSTFEENIKNGEYNW